LTVTYWDQARPSFGVRVGLLGKTFVLVRGKNRKRVSLGKYPRLASRKSAEKALAIMDGTDAILATQGPTSRIAEYVKQLAGTEPHRYEQQRLLEPTYNAAPSQLLPIITTYAPNDIVLARWGFVPEGWHSTKLRPQNNARAR